MNKIVLTFALLGFTPSIALAGPPNQSELELCFASARTQTSNLIAAARVCAGVQRSQTALDCFKTARNDFSLIVPLAAALCEGVTDFGIMRSCVERLQNAGEPDEVVSVLCSQK